MNQDNLQKIILDALEQSKADKVLCLNISQLTNIADVFIICSANSSRHAKAIQDNLVETLLQNNIKPLGIESDPKGEWILIDCLDIVIHIMQKEAREFYNLEKLWTVHAEAEVNS